MTLATPNSSQAPRPRAGNQEKAGRDGRTSSSATQDDCRPVPAFFLRAVDLGLLTALFVVPLMMGGRQSLGQFVLAAAACWTALAWAIHQVFQPRPQWIWTRAEPLLLAAAALVVLQIIHLPPEIVHRLSPRIAELLPLWASQADSGPKLGEWSRLSLAPAASQSALVIFLAYAMLFCVAAQRLRRLEDVERVLRWIAIAAAGMALFGLVQYLAGNGKFFWFYEHPYTTAGRAPKGSFTNKNHFAHFLVLGIGPLIWWLVRTLRAGQASHLSLGSTLRAAEGRPAPERPRAAERSGRKETIVALLTAALGTVIFAGLLSLSRGGTLGILIAVAVCLVILYSGRLVSGKLVSGLGCAGLLLSACLTIYGYDAISRRLENWTSPARWQIWQANLALVSEFPLVGTGIGSHSETHPLHLDQPYSNREFTHAENSYLQVASEAGLTGFALALIGVGMCSYWCVRGIQLSQKTQRTTAGKRAADGTRSVPATFGQQTTAAFAAIAAGLAAHLVHAFGDFIWYVPGCMVVVTLLAAAACRLFQIIRDARPGAAAESGVSRGPFLRWAWAASLAPVVILGAWMLRTQLPLLAAEPHWHDYLRLTLLADAQEQTDSATVLRQKAAAVVAAAKANPGDSRIQFNTATMYLALFHALQQADGQNAMPLEQIRDAALVSNFESPEALQEWLMRAIGENYKYLRAALSHARKALELCPLEGQAYLALAELDFLEGAPRENQAHYISQAIAVRPYDAPILFAAGLKAFSTGDSATAIEHWRGAFHRDVALQQRIIGLLAAKVPARVFIETFQPDREALGRMRDYLRPFNRPADYAVVARSYAQATELHARQLHNNQAANCWLSLQQTYDELGEPEQALKCLQAAYEDDPHSFKVRYALGTWLYAHERYSDAAVHLAWCSNQTPNNRNLQRMADFATGRRLRLQSANRPPASDTTSRKSPRL